GDYERRQTLTGAERYVTPELKQYEAKVLGAEERIATREAELIDALRRRVADVIGRVQATAAVLAGLDVWSALADVAHHEGYVRPEVNDGLTIALEGSRHPVVERMMAREAFIPNDVLLDASGRVILLTGPNMAGKSTLLRQVGLCVLLAQMGAFVPARRAVVGRAWQVLKLLEAGHHVARQASPAPPDATQLGLFAPPPPHPLLQELDGLNVDALSPLDALNRLAAWKKRRAEEGA